MTRSYTLPFVCAALALASSAAFAQAVVPGEFTDPSNLRRQLAEASGYQTPEHLKVPYISTYYVKPKVSASEEAKIGYFVTDWDSSRIRFLDDSFRFDIFVEYYAESNTPKRLVQRGVKSGDGVISLGRLPKGDYNVGIWARDASLTASGTRLASSPPGRRPSRRTRSTPSQRPTSPPTASAMTAASAARSPSKSASFRPRRREATS